MENQNFKPKPETEELEFTVMPKQFHQSIDAKAEVHRIMPHGASHPGLRNHLKLGLIVLGVLVVLGGGGYLIVRRLGKTEPQPPSPPSPIQVPEPEPVKKDADGDGLSAAEEVQYAVNAGLADTDGDGLADGDEVNIYLSDPLLSDSDGDGFDDGREVARGYSPILKSGEKATATEIKSWSDLIAVHKLHEPTPTTLKLKAQQIENQSKVSYTNSKYKYTIELPAVLTFRESDEGRLVGIYISGTNPEGEILTDPINLSVAVKVAGQSLKDWAQEQHPTGTYEFLQERDIGSMKTIRLVGVKDESCPMNQTFFAKDSTVIIVSWTCNQNSSFGDLYEQIVQSFKFN